MIKKIRNSIDNYLKSDYPAAVFSRLITKMILLFSSITVLAALEIISLITTVGSLIVIGAAIVSEGFKYDDIMPEKLESDRNVIYNQELINELAKKGIDLRLAYIKNYSTTSVVDTHCEERVDFYFVSDNLDCHILRRSSRYNKENLDLAYRESQMNSKTKYIPIIYTENMQERILSDKEVEAELEIAKKDAVLSLALKKDR